MDFAQRQAHNQRCSAALVGVFIVFFLFIGAAVDILHFDDVLRAGPALPVATLFALGFAAVTTLTAYYGGSDMILSSLGAEKLNLQIPEHRELHNIVTEMALASGSPMPRIFVIFDPAPNALATGTNEKNAAVCVTTGLLTLLDREETQGVIAHEISHIRNDDVLLMTLVSILLGGVAILADWDQRGFYGSRSGRRLAGKNILLIIPLLILIALSPLIARLLAMAVSRQREYLADATAAEYTRNPRGLARALEKIRDAAMPFHKATRGTAHLFLINPLRRRIDEREENRRLARQPSADRTPHSLIVSNGWNASALGSRCESSSASIEQNLRMLRCPQCDCEMAEVMARANPGTLIQLDQCGKCGGVWCDKWELFPVDPDESDRLDPLNENLLREALPLPQKTLYCPRCADALRIFADPILPKEIQLQRCRHCDGIWLNRGQFHRYKDYQRGTRAVKMSEEKVVAKLPEVYANPKSWVVTGTKGIYAYPRGEEDDSANLVAKSFGSAAKLVLQSLVRMILGI